MQGSGIAGVWSVGKNLNWTVIVVTFLEIFDAVTEFQQVDIPSVFRPGELTVDRLQKRRIRSCQIVIRKNSGRDGEQIFIYLPGPVVGRESLYAVER